ncbi:MAG TPA: hypothetical protein PKY82_02350 [Pyrinomonadaceae bacterium]|nr:hypothetical protein [Pyrinomonadaceae bacterium]
MEVKSLEELNNIKNVNGNGNNSVVEPETSDSLKLDEPTDTTGEKKKKSGKKKYFVIGLLLTILLIGSYFFLSSLFSSTKKNTIVAKNKDSNTSTMPGFSPENASKVLVNDVNTNTNSTQISNPAQNISNSNSNISGQQGKIQPMPPMEKNPVFGNVQPQSNNNMNVPVADQIGANSNSNTASPQTNQVKTNVAPASTPNPLFNNTGTNEVKSNSGQNRGTAGASQTSGQSYTFNEPIRSTPSQQKSYFLFAKDSKNKPVRENKQESEDQNVNQNTNQNVNQNINSRNNAPVNPIELEKRPPFGTMLPLQTLGAIDTLGNTPLIRLVLTRTMKGEGWELERGTIFVGRATGGRGNRAYVQVVGYLDADSNALIRVGGDLQGVDGASGLLGEKKKLGSKWLNVIREVGNKAYQTANTWISSRNGSGTNITLPSQTEMGMSTSGNNNIEYVFVRPNSFGYFLVNDLPKEIKSESAPLPNSNTENVVDETQDNKYMPEAEVINLVSRGNVDEIRKAMPRIRPEYRKSIEEVLRTKGIN